ncbi:MAG: hypothetical protein WBD00_05535 [Candidatus Omnitrophota bacterium]|jgi:hypothetical protein
MKKAKANKISSILVVVGIFLLILPLCDLVTYNQQGFLFAGAVSLLAAFMFQQLAGDKRKGKE